MNIGDRVKLIRDNPSDNSELFAGSEGTIIYISPRLTDDDDKILVIWDRPTEDSECNNHLIEEYFPDLSEIERYDTYADRFWWVLNTDIKVLYPFPPYRKKKTNESQQLYRVCRKIYELDLKWKEKQLAKTSNISL